MLDDTLHFLANHLEAPDWRRLGEHLPVEWIEQAVLRTEATSIRHRRLPAEQVVWLMVALALYRHKSISEVLDDLGLAVPDSQTPFVSKSAVAQARQRLGSDPLKWLFDHSVQHWSKQDRGTYLFKGLVLFAMDGTTLRTHDIVEDREHFGAQNYASGAIASYPQVRGVTLTALSTHIVHSAAFGPYGTNEMLYAKQLIDGVPNDSLTVFDRGFLSAEILCALTRGGSERHFIIPAKSNTRWEIIEGDDEEDDFTVRMRVSPQARAKCAELPQFWEARAIAIVDHQGRKRILLTSLRDQRRYKPLDIANCYARRWGIETSYRELNQTMLGTTLTLRSKTVDGVYQEIWGTLIAYNLIRLEIAKAALVVKCEPTEVSFIRAFHLIQFELHWTAVTRSYGKLPASMKHLRERLVSLLKDERPDRKFDRAVKAKPKRYATRVLRKPA
ncbi:IS4 family transposase [Glaciimonas sp. CA11.2]|uniref:IS4 family transposase n=1 Tax=Glaciimonas sp. CA11.2 TaxID=3048601 RepID=UPI002AB3491C|nr:IS4 family transposase [Glaciimonas sp. CA11.2]MDY7548196.1 IS4 family transposase [Glaciimonas sp. CA11.2]MEB0164819.1 IS4 family transposase [Glaciimonas sp. CA11.2]